MSKESANIIVDIDSLLDTRQGVLSKLMNQESLLKLVTSEDYMHRLYDEFPGVDMDAYKRIYDKRDKNIISSSIVSYTFNVVKSKVINLLNKSSFNDDVKEVNLLINFYPYVLSVADKDAFIDVVFDKMGIKVFMKPVWKEPEDISASYIKSNNIENVFIYDTNRWLEANAKGLTELPITTHSVHLPALLTNKISDTDMARFKRAGFVDIHAYLEYVSSPLVALDYLPIMFYGNIITVSAELERINKLGTF